MNEFFYYCANKVRALVEFCAFSKQICKLQILEVHGWVHCSIQNWPVQIEVISIFEITIEPLMKDIQAIEIVCGERSRYGSALVLLPDYLISCSKSSRKRRL